MKQYTISILVENVAGVLSQVTRLFTRKNYNIDSLAVGVTDDPSVSRITVIVTGDDHMVSQLTSQLGKQIHVISVKTLPDDSSISRELVLVKVKAASREVRNEIIQLAGVFRSNIIDVCIDSVIIAVIGGLSKSEALLEILREYGILEVVRTGMVSLERGSGTIYDAAGKTNASLKKEK